MKSIRMTIGVLALAALAGCSSGSGASGGNRVTTLERVAIASFQRPAWASADTYAGRVDPSERVTVQVHLAMHDEAGARALLAEVSNPSSPAYGRFLTTDEYNARFAPSPEDVAVVRAHLEANGLTVVHVPANRAYVEASGVASAIEAAFGARLGRYAHGRALRRAPLDPPTLPADVAARVHAVLGLSTPPRATPAHARRKAIPAQVGAAPTCSSYYGQYLDTSDPRFGTDYPPTLPLALCTGYTGAQLQQGYGLDRVIAAGLDGSGETVATVDAWMATTFQSDVDRYAAEEVPPQPFKAGQLITRWTPGAPTVEPPDDDWGPEQALDVESIHAMAPGATIAYTAAQSDSEPDLLAAFHYIIANDFASIISFSAGWPESMETESSTWELMAIQAGLKGIGLYSGSGDAGDWVLLGGTSSPNATFPNSLPEFTSVGGTSLALGRDNERVFELGFEEAISQIVPPGCGGVWPNGPVCEDGGIDDAGVLVGGGAWWPAAPGGYYGGAGGGPSAFFAQPSYQRGVVPASIAGGSSPMRVAPDVAMLADWSIGFQVGVTYGGQYGIFPLAGTSLSGPLFAATVAIAQQLHAHRYGAGNATFYAAAARGAFRDIAPAAQAQADVYPAALVSPDPLYDANGENYLATFDYHGPDNSLATREGYDDVTGLGAPNGESFLLALP